MQLIFNHIKKNNVIDNSLKNDSFNKIIVIDGSDNDNSSDGNIRGIFHVKNNIKSIN